VWLFPLLALAMAAPACAATPIAHGVTPGLTVQTTAVAVTGAPSNVAIAPDGKVLVAEVGGQVQLFDNIGDPTPTTVIDVSAETFSTGNFGLLGLALDPDFTTNRRVYVMYTYDPTGFNDQCPDDGGGVGCPVTARISRFTLDADFSGAGPEQVLVDSRWCFVDGHSGADLAFLPDGTLVASAGDGAGAAIVEIGQQAPGSGGTRVPNPCADPPEPLGTPLSAPSSEGGALRSQDLLTSGDPTGFDGTVIRIDPNTGQAPADNPLVGNGVADDDPVIAFGFRNPFRLTVRPGTDEVWVGDVGWHTWEEIDRISSPTGAVAPDYGWPCYEGADRQPLYENAGLTLCQGLYDGTFDATLQGPYYEYQHGNPPDPFDCGTGSSSALSGLAFYDGDLYSSHYRDGLFFGDFIRSCVWFMPAGSDGLPDPSQVETVAAGVSPMDIEQGPDGAMYVLDIDGHLLRLAPTGS
jgi:glucose/arabinose dehydrogenase